MVKFVDFSQALDKVKQGGRMEREGWDRWEQYVRLSYGQQRHGKTYDPFLLLHTPRDRRIPWLPSQHDILAEDWIVKD